LPSCREGNTSKSASSDQCRKAHSCSILKDLRKDHHESPIGPGLEAFAKSCRVMTPFLRCCHLARKRAKVVWSDQFEEMLSLLGT
jgi:hypothetical protein